MRPVLSQSIQVLSLAIVSSAMLLNSCDNFSSAQEQSEDLAIQDASVEEPIQSDSAAASPRDVSPVAVEEPPSAASSNIPDPQPSGDLAQAHRETAEPAPLFAEVLPPGPLNYRDSHSSSQLRSHS